VLDDFEEIDAAGTPPKTGGVDLFEVIEHELGHVLGYAHTDADEHSVMHATLPVTLAPSTVATIADLLAPRRALLASNSPAAITVMQQGLSRRAQLQLAAPAASLVFELAAPSESRVSRFVALPTLLLRGIAPVHASLVGLVAGGRVQGFDTYLSE